MPQHFNVDFGHVNTVTKRFTVQYKVEVANTSITVHFKHTLFGVLNSSLACMCVNLCSVTLAYCS